MSTDFDTLLGRYLDGDLDDPEIRRFAEILRSDPEARRTVSAFEGLDALLGELREEAPPPVEDPVARAMARIATRPAPRRPLWRRLGEALSAGPWRMATAGGALLLFGLVVGLGAGRIGGPSPEPTEETLLTSATPDPAAGTDVARDVMVHFVLAAPEARRVSVVGDFNGWDPLATPLEKAGQVFRAVVPLPPGRYEYQFVVDGETWLVDPAAHRTVDDGFGGRNGVLEV
jgi:anti-sigma factor RsiW